MEKFLGNPHPPLYSNTKMYYTINIKIRTEKKARQTYMLSQTSSRL